MEMVITTAVLGLVLVVIGILNLKGNISSLHSYHRHRVAKEDLLPFGKRVGTGTILCGLACIFFAFCQLIHEMTTLALFIWIGTAGLLVGLAIGIVLMLKAIIKYNKGLF